MARNLHVRRVVDMSFRLAREIEIRLKSKREIRHLVYFPLVHEEGELSDILNRANWYFPEKCFSRASIIIPVSPELFNSVEISEIKPPQNQGNFIAKNPRIKIAKINSNAELNDLAKKSDAIVLWDTRHFFKIPRVLFNFDKIWITDPAYLQITEARNYFWLHNLTIPKEKLEHLFGISKKNFETLLAMGRTGDKSYVFGTGPSASQSINFDFSDGFRIVANTMINDRKLMGHIKPHAIVFGDFVYHAGPSKYAAKFRKQMREVCRKKCYGLIRFDVMPLMLSYFPELGNRLIGIPSKLFSHPVIPTPEKFFVMRSNNSLVTYMLPVASSVSDHIFIVGCDGRKPEDKYHWSHGKTTHYDSLTQTAVATHPSVFRDTDFNDYYKAYCKDAEKFISYGESLGKTYVPLTSSYIPALKKRLPERSAKIK